MKNFIYLVLFVIFFTNINASRASIPTIEGLFRNNNNPDMKANMVVLKYSTEWERKSEVETEAPVITKEYSKVIFEIEDNNINVLEIVYSDQSMNENKIIGMRYIRHIINHFKNLPASAHKIFSGALLMLTLNDSKLLSSALKEYSPDFKQNSEAVNPEKLKLLGEYKKFLDENKNKLEGSEVKATNPLHPEDDLEKTKAAQMLSNRFFEYSQNVNLNKDGRNFYWDVHLEKIQARFDCNTLRIRNLMVMTDEDSYDLEFGEFFLFDGVHELPKQVIFKQGEHLTTKIQFLGLSSFDNKGDSLKKRAESYSEIFTKLRSSQKDSFQDVMWPMSLSYKNTQHKI